MRTLYLDCASGISGNMFFAAMLDAGLDAAPWREALRRLELPQMQVQVQEVHRAGLRATHAEVQFPHEHVHRHLTDVLKILQGAALPPGVYRRAESIFYALAEAEAEIHGTSIHEVHFHEVGAQDAIVDVMSAAFFLEAAAVERVVASPIRVGKGTVRCAHGEMPIPAPATALLLRGVPTYAGLEEGEFTTPTGAAILKACVDEYSEQPLMRVERIGHGAGSRQTRHANVLRVFLGQAEQPKDSATGNQPAPWEAEAILFAECHIDDMTGEEIGFLLQTLLDGPALDALAIPAIGKKNRPAFVVRALAPLSKEHEILSALFRHSTSLGVRCEKVRRAILPRRELTIESEWGTLRAKCTFVDGEWRASPEYDDLVRAAQRAQCSLFDMRSRFAPQLAPDQVAAVLGRGPPTQPEE